MAVSATSQIAASFGLAEEDLFEQALISFLKDKKRQVLQLKLELLSRYNVDNVPELEEKIRKGTVVEHPAWEDLIVAENLSVRLEELDAHLKKLQKTGTNRIN